jgi:amino acid adenylation domain-containing protein
VHDISNTKSKMSASECQPAAIEPDRLIAPGDRCIHQLFEDQVARTPQAVAVVFESNHLCYGELNAKANQLAHYLIDSGIKADTMVGLSIEPSLEQLVVILAIWKAGGAYVPIDPAYPTARIHYLLQDSAITELITFTHGLKNLNLDTSLSRSIHSICLDAQTLIGLLDGYSTQNPDAVSSSHQRSRVKPENLAYVIYTSGSTGKPKGVMIEHRSAVNLFSALADVISINRLPNNYHALLNTPISFDFSVQQIMHLLVGAQLHILSNENRLNPEKFLHYLESHQILTFEITPSLLNILLSHTKNSQLTDHPSIITVGGEEIDHSLWNKLRTLANSRCFNVYGPTECTVHTTIKEILPSDKTPVIGRPLNNVQCYLLDGQQHLVSEGEAGEIYIGGAGLARAYLNRCELTDEHFISNPFSTDPASRLYKTGDRAQCRPDGSYEFLGRMDSQVKIRGFRIELGEIEAQLKEHYAVDNAAVIVAGDTSEIKRLVAYVVKTSAPGTDNETEFLKSVNELLKIHLPAHMLPSHTIVMDSLPLTHNGKLDRSALPIPNNLATIDKDTIAAITPEERRLVNIWRKIFNVDHIGIDENFFELGGNSMLAMQLISTIRHQLDIEVSVSQIFKHPTIYSLARQICPSNSAPTTSGASLTRASLNKALLAKAPKEESQYLSYEELFLSMGLKTITNRQNIQIALTINGDLNRHVLIQSFQEIVKRHTVLQSYFTIENNSPTRNTTSHADFSLAEIDLSALDDRQQQLHIEEQLRHDGRPFDLSIAPLFRAGLLTLESERHLFILTINHTIADDRSIEILLQELSVLYQADDQALAALPIQYSDYARWQRQWLESTESQRQMDYWKKQLSNLPPLLDLPTDRDRPTHPGSRLQLASVTLTQAQTQELLKLAREQHATTYLVLLTAVNIVMAYYAKQNDILIHCPVSSRNQSVLDNVIGCFVNMVVMRNTVDLDSCFTTNLRRVKENALQAFDNQSIPYSLLERRLKDRYNNNHIQVTLDMPSANSQLNIPGLEISSLVQEQRFDPIETTDVPDVDLVWMLVETPGGVMGRLVYNGKIFDEKTIHNIINTFTAFIQLILENSEAPINELLNFGE